MKKELLREFRRSLRLLEREFEIALSAETQCCDVSLPQCHAMIELDLSGEISLSDLAERLELDKSTLSRTVESLVNEEFAVRNTDAADRRAVKITLSDKGREKVVMINSLCDKYYDELMTGIPQKERKEVIDSVGILAEAMKRFRTRTLCCGCKRGDDE